jgi:nucleotide-binding universal stress UspA family protein
MKILVPYDFSQQSEVALKSAANLTEKYQGEIHVLHVINLPEYYLGSSLTEFMKNDEGLGIKQKVEQRLSALSEASYFKNKSVNYVLDNGPILATILDYSEKNDIDLLIMSTEKANDEVLLEGSFTKKVVHHSSVPVMIVKEELETLSLEQCLIASTFSNVHDVSADELMHMAKEISREIHLLNVVTPKMDINKSVLEANMAAFAKKYEIIASSKAVFEDNSVEDGILNYSNLNSIDLIIMETHARTGLDHFFNGSKYELVVSKTKQPVLCMKMHRNWVSPLTRDIVI